MNVLSEATTRFAYDLFQQFRQSKKENIFYSPLSVTAALAMTYLGSQGNTASEIQKVGVTFLYVNQLELVSLLTSVQMITHLAVSLGTGSRTSIPMTGLCASLYLDFLWGLGLTPTVAQPPDVRLKWNSSGRSDLKFMENVIKCILSNE